MVTGHPSAFCDALQVTRARCGPRSSGFTSRPRRVHSANYAGRNLTDRQHIRRKVAELGRRYKALATDSPKRATLGVHDEAGKQAAAIIDRIRRDEEPFPIWWGAA